MELIQFRAFIVLDLHCFIKAHCPNLMVNYIESFKLFFTEAMHPPVCTKYFGIVVHANLFAIYFS